MKFAKIKEGQRLIIKNQKPGLQVSPIGDEFIGKTGVVTHIDRSDNTARIMFDHDGHSLWVNPHWVEPFDEEVTKDTPSVLMISREDMNRIYEIACGEWKTKLQEHFKHTSPFSESFEVSTEFATQMLRASTDKQKPIVSEILSKAGYKTPGGEFINFGHEHTFNQGASGDISPLYIRNGHASNNSMECKEIGFSNSFIAQVFINGTMHEIDTSNRDGNYIRFKKK